jgi:hypothetical protein
MSGSDMCAPDHIRIGRVVLEVRCEGSTTEFLLLEGPNVYRLTEAVLYDDDFDGLSTQELLGYDCEELVDKMYAKSACASPNIVATYRIVDVHDEEGERAFWVLLIS